MKVEDAWEGGEMCRLRPDMVSMPALGPQYGAIMVERVRKISKRFLKVELGEDGDFVY
jgi:hypothetical protein